LYAGNYSSSTARDISHNWVPRFLLPAVREAGDDPRAPVAPIKFDSPYGLSSDGHRL